MKETQPATDNSDSTTASTSSVRAPVLQKFTFLAAKMTNTHVGNKQGLSPQEQLDKYMTELQSYGGTNGQQFWMDRQAINVPQFCATGVGLVVGTSIRSITLNASSPPAESLLLESAEEKLGDACLPEAEQ